MRRGISWGAWLAATLVLAACGTPSKPHVNNSGSTGSSGGSTSSAGCGDGGASCPRDTFCIGGRCGTCDGLSPLQCPAGERCNTATHDCEAVGGSSSSSSGGASSFSETSSSSGSSSAPGCVHRQDCPGAQACLGMASDGGQCGTPAPDAGCTRNDDCLKAQICQAYRCVPGCFNNLDCHGTRQPVCTPGNPGQCGPCTTNTQCLAGENCENGQCVPKQTCTDATSCGDLGCVNGYCGPCTGNLDCAGGNLCDPGTGHCVPPSSGCSSDAECQQQHSGSLAWYCAAPGDGGTSQCQVGCVPDSKCVSPQPGCCDLAGGQSCDQTTHACTQVGGSSSSSSGSAGSSSSSSGSAGSSSSSSGSAGSGSSSSGSSSSSSSGSSSSSSGTLQPICGPCSTDGDCQSGFCNIYTDKAPYCDAAAGYCSVDQDCSPATTCDLNTNSCLCPNGPQGYYCDYCTGSNDCGANGLCVVDASLFATECATPCDAPDGGCVEPNSACSPVYNSNSGQLVGNYCFPASGICNY